VTPRYITEKKKGERKTFRRGKDKNDIAPYTGSALRTVVGAGNFVLDLFVPDLTNLTSGGQYLSVINMRKQLGVWSTVQ
jgi:hypothetical protein